jgi:Protein of unknown function (DUF1559)
MPYLFTCPHCQSQTQVEDRYSGQAGQCVTCGGDISIPGFVVGANSGRKTTKETKLLAMVLGGGVLIILLGCLLYSIVRVGGQTMTQLSDNRERTASKRNLEKIADALNAYAADHGAYPPPMTQDGNNQPLHSWRVLILPYLGEDDLYNQIDLKKPWHDQQNMQIAYTVPSVFQHPNSGSNGIFNQSAYYVITGQGTLFPNTGALGLDGIVDDPAQTILVIEGTPLVPSGCWTEPVDLDFAKMQGNLANRNGFEPGGLVAGGVMMATADGRGHFLPDTTDPAIVRALVTPRGGERLRSDTLD